MFKVMKPTHMCHPLLAFCSRIVLSNQVGYFISLLNPVSDSFPSSSLIDSFFYSLYTTSMEEGRTERRWLATLVSILGMLEETRLTS